jgi:hypothetical protein
MEGEPGKQKSSEGLLPKDKDIGNVFSDQVGASDHPVDDQRTKLVGILYLDGLEAHVGWVQL